MSPSVKVNIFLSKDLYMVDGVDLEVSLIEVQQIPTMQFIIGTIWVYFWLYLELSSIELKCVSLTLPGRRR